MFRELSPGQVRLFQATGSFDEVLCILPMVESHRDEKTRVTRGEDLLLVCFVLASPLRSHQPSGQHYRRAIDVFVAIGTRVVIERLVLVRTMVPALLAQEQTNIDDKCTAKFVPMLPYGIENVIVGLKTCILFLDSLLFCGSRAHDVD